MGKGRKNKPRSGFTTGTAAAAAAKGAVRLLATGKAPGAVEVSLPAWGFWGAFPF